MVPGFLLASGRCYWTKETPIEGLDAEPSLQRKYFSLLAYIIGVCLTISADCQKNFILKYTKTRPFLITDGLFYYTRNPNYLGEMLLYGSFATLTNHKISYAIILFAFCSIFPARIIQKEFSLMRKPGWSEYSSRSNILFPRILPVGDEFYLGVVIFVGIVS